jgi:beta-phosphoglucomutase family hydrolase
MTDDPGTWLAAWSGGTGFDAALFDLDGVLTPTAEVHMRAWQAMFDDYFGSRRISPPYTSADYFAHVDGKPRYDGVRSCLASRSRTIPDGDPSDSPGTESVCGLGNTKNEKFEQMLREDGVTAYPGSLALLHELIARGVKMAVVSSSRNAPDVLASAGIADLFPVVVDGTVAGDVGLRGKPSGDTYVYAAQRLGVPVERAVVLEDAVSGVAAGRDGGFGLVVGVDRGAGVDTLTAAGANMVVRDLAELVGR